MVKHSVKFQIKKVWQRFMNENTKFLGQRDTRLFASPLRKFAIENGISEADIDKCLAARIANEERSRQAEREGTGPGARLLRAIFTPP